MPAKMKSIGIRLSVEDAKKIEETATRRNKSISEFIREAVAMYAEFDDKFLKFVEGAAQNLQVPPFVYIQNMIIDRFAEYDAEDSIYGPNAGGAKTMLHQFQMNRTGMITGQELYNILFAMHKNKFEAESKNNA